MKEYTSYKISLKPSVAQEALNCFRAKGIRAVKMNDIAHNLGISKRTLYELYSNKEGVLIGVITLLCEQRKEHIRQVNEECDDVMDLLLDALGWQLEAATNTCREFYRDLQRYPRAEEVLAKHYASELKSAGKFFASGIREGYFIPKLDYRVMLQITAGTMRMIRTSEEYAGLTYHDLFLNFLYPTVRGICTAKGVDKIDAFVKERF